MAFRIRDLSVLSCTQGFTVWHYKAAALADVLKAGFFDDASDMIVHGDHMHVSASDGGALLSLSVFGNTVRVATMSATMPMPAQEAA